MLVNQSTVFIEPASHSHNFFDFDGYLGGFDRCPARFHVVMGRLQQLAFKAFPGGLCINLR